ncbi:pyridoxamine 5'-phosphate oxidase family protein [Thermosediminibacter oceani]|uniref:Pyridoxamine 5'-phosphate oxidase-related FMN-binding protein n=1 Tax=Thermosediminibacter oceani (strain ATCC BAA-1034 / DSM 16646 / JW/IW-1228P) TaxID=555079 RepID=D9RZB0_THEOJ|nr:pyridoxamine 5'-phosphate oxidase family protein [Thermosediminibacter oceani]ADL08664.1 pyridoxamine 5'-phosphate oxidase-related FMN-binding protein [Thermosediminibacter oceani DSM 16646]
MKTEEVIKFLNENPNGAFATVDDGKPRVRPWQFQFEENGKFYFCTSNTKDVFRQLQKNPFAEFTSTSKDMVTVRLSGRVIFTKDLDVKRKIIEKNEGIKAIYKSADNPIFEVFYIEPSEVIISDLSGNPPIKISF